YRLHCPCSRTHSLPPGTMPSMSLCLSRCLSIDRQNYGGRQGKNTLTMLSSSGSSYGYTSTHMIGQSDAVYPHGNYCPCQGSHEDVHRQPGPEAKHPHPGVDVAAPGNEPKATIEWPQFVELFPQPHMSNIVEQVIEQIAHHQTATYPPPLRIIRTGDKKARYGKIPCMFYERIEDML